MSDTSQLWSWALSVGGAGMFFMAGRKVWWCWYVGIALQAAWATYAITTAQWGFLVGCLLYTPVYLGNAILWTKQRKEGRPVGDAGQEPQRPTESTADEHMMNQPDHLVMQTAPGQGADDIWWCLDCEVGSDAHEKTEETNG